MAETFGSVLGAARRRLGLSQRELAARIFKEDVERISPQYLKDLERDRRNPTARHFLKQFAATLERPEEHLDFVAGPLPEDLRVGDYSPDQAQASFEVLR